MNDDGQAEKRNEISYANCRQVLCIFHFVANLQLPSELKFNNRKDKSLSLLSQTTSSLYDISIKFTNFSLDFFLQVRTKRDKKLIMWAEWWIYAGILGIKLIIIRKGLHRRWRKDFTIKAKKASNENSLESLYQTNLCFEIEIKSICFFFCCNIFN